MDTDFDHAADIEAFLKAALDRDLAAGAVFSAMWHSGDRAGAFEFSDSRFSVCVALKWNKHAIAKLKRLARNMETGTWLAAEVAGDKVIVRGWNYCFLNGQLGVESEELYEKLAKQPPEGRYVYLQHAGGETVYRL